MSLALVRSFPDLATQSEEFQLPTIVGTTVVVALADAWKQHEMASGRLAASGGKRNSSPSPLLFQTASPRDGSDKMMINGDCSSFRLFS